MSIYKGNLVVWLFWAGREKKAMLEKDIERRLRDGVIRMGGMCLKLVCPGFAGMPDRLIIMPGGRICFAELKRPGQVERQRQRFVQAKLRRMGCAVFSAVDGSEAVDWVLDWCRRGGGSDGV